MIFLMLLIANMRTISRNWRYQNRARTAVLDRVDSLPFETKVCLADCGFYTKRFLRNARRRAPVVVPVVPKGDRLTKNSTSRRRGGTTTRCTRTQSGN